MIYWLHSAISLGYLLNLLVKNKDHGKETAVVYIGLFLNRKMTSIEFTNTVFVQSINTFF